MASVKVEAVASALARGESSESTLDMPSDVAEMLSRAARQFGGKRFLVCGDKVLSFADVDSLASIAAQGLQRHGIRQDDVVTLWMENGWRWVVAYYAALRIGAVVNPVNIVLTHQEIDFIVRDCKSKVLIGAADKVRTLRTDPTLIVIDDLAGFDDLLDTQRAPDASRATLSASAPAAICYTSGTTGHPKGAVIRHRSVVVNTLMTALMHGRSSADTVVSALPCTHVYGNVVMNSAVAAGMTLVLLPRFEERLALDAIQEHRATMFEGVPTMYMKMMNFPDFLTFDLSSLRICTVGGQTMPVATMKEVEQRFGCRLIELWGMTELAGLGTTHPYNGPSKLGSIGIPLPLTQAKVADQSDGARQVPRGDVGELLIRGPLVMKEYFGNVSATTDSVDADGWLRTGDLVREDEDGYLYVVDRKKEVIINGGYNVYPAEVERVIAQHPAVAMVAVAAAADELRGQVPKAFIVLKHGTTCTSEAIISHCRAYLAAYKTPVAVEFLDDLPKTSTGKILRRALATTNV